MTLVLYLKCIAGAILFCIIFIASCEIWAGNIRLRLRRKSVLEVFDDTLLAVFPCGGELHGVGDSCRTESLSDCRCRECSRDFCKGFFIKCEWMDVESATCACCEEVGKAMGAIVRGEKKENTSKRRIRRVGQRKTYFLNCDRNMSNIGNNNNTPTLEPFRPISEGISSCRYSNARSIAPHGAPSVEDAESCTDKSGENCNRTEF